MDDGIVALIKINFKDVLEGENNSISIHLEPYVGDVDLDVNKLEKIMQVKANDND